MKGLHVVPVLLEQRDQEVDGHQRVGAKLIGVHVDVTDGDTDAQHLLKLELDLRLELGDLGGDRVSSRDGCGELTSLVKTRTKNTRDLSDEGLRGQEGIEGISELLDELLVLVQLLEVIKSAELEAELLSQFAVSDITDDANSHAGAGDVGELDGTSETLVSLGIVVLKTDLEFDGLGELALLLLGSLEDRHDGLLQSVDAKLVAHGLAID